MDRLAEWFVLKIEEVSTVSIRFLDISVRRDGDRLICSPFLKDPGLARRLSACSAHPLAVHKSWPKVMLRRMGLLSNSEQEALAFVEEMTRRLMRDGCLVPPEAAASSSAVGGVRVKRRGQRGELCTLWLPLRYHPFWNSQVKKATSRFNKERSMASLLSIVPSFQNSTVRLAWKNMLPAVDTLLL